MVQAPEQPRKDGQAAERSGQSLLQVLPPAVWVCLLLAAVVLVVFWPAVGCDFINYDDPAYFSFNRRVLGGLNWRSVGWAFSTTDNASWYPLTWLSFLADATLFGSGPSGPHLTNVLLHTANGVLLFAVLRQLTGAHWRSALVAALFALHPLRVESVAWISERKGLLCAFFGLLTLWAYARYSQNRVETQTVLGCGLRPITDHPPWACPSAPRQLPAGLWFLAALFFFACSLLSKPALVALPCALLLLDYWPLNRFELGGASTRLKTLVPFLREKIPFLLIALVSSAVTFQVHRMQGAVQSLGAAPVPARIETALVSYSRYLGKTFWPARLALPYPAPGAWPVRAWVLNAVLLAGLSLLAVGLGRRKPYLFTGWFWFVVMLLPVIGLIGWGSHTLADRFTYVPQIGLFVALVWGGAELWAGQRKLLCGAGIIAGLLLGACAIRTRDQLYYWHGSERLFRHSLAVTKDNIVALNQLGVRLSFEGRSKEAFACFHEALRLNPDGLQVVYNLGNALAAIGQYAEAITNFERVVRGMPEHYEARNNLGLALAKLGRLDEAFENCRLAMQIRPDDPRIHRNLGDLSGAQGKLAEAAEHYRDALKIEPADDNAHYSLGITLALLGRWEEACEEYRRTLRLTPTNAEALYNLGYALRMQGRLPEAAARFGEALRLKPAFPLAHYNLGCVLADQGQRAEAIVHLNEALRLKPDYEAARQKLAELRQELEEGHGD